MDLLIALLAAIVGYLCGSISFARLITRIVAPETDVTKTEIKVADSEEKITMGAVSATSVSMHIGARFGFITVVLDMLKIAVPALVFKHVYPDTSYFLITATAGMIGHIWPLYHSFRGGRGLSAVYGGMFAIDWIGVFATSLVGMFLGIFVLRDVLVAYMGGLWLIIPWLWFRTHDLGHLAYALAVNIIFGLAMIPEIRQYIKFKREGKGADISQTMQYTGMGRGIYKMARRFGVLKDQPKSDDDKEGGIA
jgi:glycerol-3-phosphate acyltransferase PlsY